MTSTPNFTDPQFVDANGLGGLNAAFNTVSGSIVEVSSGAWAAPGLLAPEVAQFTFSGLNLTTVLNPPWGIITVNGAIARAHGTQTGADTQTYATSFSSLVPGAGSITAYLAATVQQIQQNPVPIPGPPPGHPSYNPNFTPIVGYATTVNSVALAAVTGGIDNVNTFELLRTTLSAGQTSITNYTTAGWLRASDRRAIPNQQLLVGGNLTVAQTQAVLTPYTANLTHTLPATSLCGGLNFQFVNTSNGTWTIVTTGNDIIAGTSTTSSANTATVIQASGALELWTAGSGVWNAIASPAFAGLTPGTFPGATVVVGSQGNITSVSSVAYGPLAANNVWTGQNTFDQTIDVTGNVIATSYGQFVDPNTGGVQIVGTNGPAGANLALLGNGATTPNKYIRANNGVFQLVNSAYNGVIFAIDDSGNITSAGNNNWYGTNNFTNTVTVPNAIGATSPVALGQFSYNYTATGIGYMKLPNGYIFQVITSGVPAGNGITETTVTLPITFPTTNAAAMICFYGTTPPSASYPGSIAVEPFTNSQVLVTTNYTSSSVTLGVIIWAMGY